MSDCLPFDDISDFDEATRGFIATLDDPMIRGDKGNVVYEASAFEFIKADAPDTANPSLWRQSQLNAANGLFEVAEGIYQVRGLDVSNVSFIRGKGGWIVVDLLPVPVRARDATSDSASGFKASSQNSRLLEPTGGR